jgi:hypothetical protein
MHAKKVVQVLNLFISFMISVQTCIFRPSFQEFGFVIQYYHKERAL